MPNFDEKPKPRKPVVIVVGGDDRVPHFSWPDGYDFKFYQSDKYGGNGELKKATTAIAHGPSFVLLLLKWIGHSMSGAVLQAASRAKVPCQIWGMGVPEAIKKLPEWVDPVVVEEKVKTVVENPVANLVKIADNGTPPRVFADALKEVMRLSPMRTVDVAKRLSISQRSLDYYRKGAKVPARVYGRMLGVWPELASEPQPLFSGKARHVLDAREIAAEIELGKLDVTPGLRTIEPDHWGSRELASAVIDCTVTAKDVRNKERDVVTARELLKAAEAAFDEAVKARDQAFEKFRVIAEA